MLSYVWLRKHVLTKLIKYEVNQVHDYLTILKRVQKKT